MDTVDEKIKQFFYSYERLHFKPNTYILRPREKMKSIYYIEHGRVRQSYITQNGEESTLHIFTEGASIPLMLILADRENQYYFETMDEVIAYKAPVEKVIAFIKEHNDVAFDLSVRFAKGLTGMLMKADSVLFSTAFHKVISALLYFSEKFGEDAPGTTYTKITIPLTHHDIASWVGLQRETVSRQLEKLIRDHVVIRENKYFLIDRARLQTIQDKK